MLDASLIANEVIDSILKNKENDVLCKLDIEKAYKITCIGIIFSSDEKDGVWKEMG